MRTLDPGSLARTLTLILLVLIAWLSLRPAVDPGQGAGPVFEWIAAVVLGDPSMGDKVKHTTAYTVLSAIAWAGYQSKMPAAAITAAVLGYAGLMEVLQIFRPDRDPSMGDMLANALGTGLGTVAAVLLARLTRSGAYR